MFSTLIDSVFARKIGANFRLTAQPSLVENRVDRKESWKILGFFLTTTLRYLLECGRIRSTLLAIRTLYGSSPVLLKALRMLNQIS